MNLFIMSRLINVKVIFFLIFILEDKSPHYLERVSCTIIFLYTIHFQSEDSKMVRVLSVHHFAAQVDIIIIIKQ